ncbi:MAG: hypothetical protein WCE79_03215 [Xanthobacteraceae bacterium]
MTTAHTMQFSFEELARTIREGALPDGSDTSDTELLDMLAEALDRLDEMQIDHLFEVTGDGSAIAERTAAKLISVETLDGSYSSDTSWACDVVTFDNSDQTAVFFEFTCSESLWLENGTCDFSFVHEVFKGADNAAPHETQSPHTFVWVIDNYDAPRPWNGYFDDNYLPDGNPIISTSSWHTALSTVGGKTCAQSFRKALPTADLASLAIANVQRGRPEWSETESD